MQTMLKMKKIEIEGFKTIFIDAKEELRRIQCPAQSRPKTGGFKLGDFQEREKIRTERSCKDKSGNVTSRPVTVLGTTSSIKWRTVLQVRGKSSMQAVTHLPKR